MQYLINSLSGKFGTSMYSSEIGKCSGVALQTSLMEILYINHIERYESRESTTN